MRVIYTSISDPSVTVYEEVQRIEVKSSKKLLSTGIELTIIRFDGSRELIYSGPNHATLQAMLSEPKWTQVNLIGYNKSNDLIKGK